MQESPLGQVFQSHPELLENHQPLKKLKKRTLIDREMLNLLAGISTQDTFSGDERDEHLAAS